MVGSLLIFSSRRLGVELLPTHSRVTPGYSRVTPGYSRIDSTLCRATFDVQFAHLLRAGCAVRWRACPGRPSACPGGRSGPSRLARSGRRTSRPSRVAAAASSTGRAARDAGSVVVPTASRQTSGIRRVATSGASGRSSHDSPRVLVGGLAILYVIVDVDLVVNASASTTRSDHPSQVGSVFDVDLDVDPIFDVGGSAAVRRRCPRR